MGRMVVFSEYGGPDVLRVVETDPPEPGRGQVRVRVAAAGIQPFDVKLRRGDTAGWAPATFPQGGGSELAGVVDELGPGVNGIAVGDEVVGWASGPAHADHALAEVDALVAKPSGMPWEEAGAVGASGQTAHTALQELAVGPAETILVHAAAGGVGTMAVQLARARRATVIGTAGPRNHDYLRGLGVEPVAYGAGLTDRVRRAAPGGIAAALDAAGTEEALRASVELVRDEDRIGTIVDPALAERFGVRFLGTQRSRRRLAELVRLYAEGRLRVHVHAAFGLTEAAAAHRMVESGHVRGKVVLVTR